ncbi:hypothetical protein MHYP_G00014910 [Metynnis hypsauchen]
MSSALYLVLLFSALWTLSFCGTRQFHVVDETKTWTDAQNYCTEKFTDLVSIESQEEMNTLIAFLNGTEDYFWIGLRQKVQQFNNLFPLNVQNVLLSSVKSWVWSDGSKSSYRYWTPGQPDNSGSDNCVHLNRKNGFRWNDAGCSAKIPFICYKDLPLILINQTKTWWEALSYCRETHVDLVSVHTEEIQHWVETAVHYASTANVWMGLRHTCAQSFWFWVSGSTICYQNWAPGNGTGVEDCSGGERTGAVQSGSKQWVSLPEDQRLNFICTTSEAPYQEDGGHWAKADAGSQGLGRRGRKSQLLAVAEKEGQVVGERRVLGVAAGGGRETSLPLLHHHEMFRDQWSETSLKGGSRLMTLQLPPFGTGGGAAGGNAMQNVFLHVYFYNLFSLMRCDASSIMSSALYLVLLFSALWTLSFCGTRQFHVVNESKNWTDAQNYCREKYTDLATTESQEEMNSIIAVVNGTVGDFWIGMNYNTNWAWSDGTAISYTYWMSGEPNNIGVENCAKFNNLYAFSWNNIQCYWTLQFICYKSLPLILIKQQKTWREALRYCRDHHVDLVSVHTEEIQHWVETAVFYASTANVWMGLRHTCAQSFWFWVSGSTMCYQNWAPGNGTGVEGCSGGERTGAVQSGSKKWVSLPEDQRLNFICTTSQEY